MIEKKESIYEKVVLVGLILKNQPLEKLEEYLDELAFLAHTAGGEVYNRFIQKLPMPDSKTFVGTGKLEEINQYCIENDIDTVMFDDELTPSQQNNLEKHLKRKVVDRTGLILDIFAQRAQTSYARTQVEVAQYEYLLPRLTRMWTHLERQRGGIGMRGPGETEIETDRRIIRDRIALLKEKLKTIDKQMDTQRGNRGKLIRVALIGYTNVGKSTVMNLLTKSNVFAQNKLFATLDTTVRKMVIGNLPFLLTDTVGFIRKLPTQLIESFKSTLDEVRQADLLIHIVDISHASFEDQLEAVQNILLEINSTEKPTLLVFNKIDNFSYTKKDEDDLTPFTNSNYSLDDWKKTWMAKNIQPTIFVSAQTKENLEELKQMLYEEVKKLHIHKFQYNNMLFEYYNNEEE